MKTPSYWMSENLISSILKPLGYIYAYATNLRLSIKHPRKVCRPVICIGNITAGGTGKTPVAVSFAKLLQQMGKNPFFVSRGYGGKLKGVMVDKSRHSAAEVGDEPLLLSRQAPVIVNPDRFSGAQKALQSGAEIIIMDDGFQNPGLHKDLSFLVFDGGVGIGNGLCIPAGPLRESLASGLKRAQAVIILGEDKHNLATQIKGLPIFRGAVVAKKPETNNNDVIAFAGIGRPEKFYTSLRELGINLLKTVDFPDHHQYTMSELKKLIDEAQKKNAVLFTTAKDFVKIPTQIQRHFHVLEIEISWENEESLKTFITQNI